MGFHVANDPYQLAAFVISVILLPICGLAIVLRFVATRQDSRRIGWEDWFALLAYIFFVVYVSLLLTVVCILNGRRLPYGVPMDQIVKVTKIGWIFAGQFCLQQLFAKMSLLFLYYRIFWVNRSFQICTWIIGALQVAWSLATFLVHFFVCNPPAKLWNPALPGTCINNAAFLAGGESINSFLDFMLVGMAIWMVQALQMDVATKMKLTVLFFLGGLAGVIGFVKIGENYAGDFSSLLDAVWAMAQQALSVICCCAPIYKHLVARMELFRTLRSMGSHLRDRVTLSIMSASKSERKGSDLEAMVGASDQQIDLHVLSTKELALVSERSRQSRE